MGSSSTLMEVSMIVVFDASGTLIDSDLYDPRTKKSKRNLTDINTSQSFLTSGALETLTKLRDKKILMLVVSQQSARIIEPVFVSHRIQHFFTVSECNVKSVKKTLIELSTIYKSPINETMVVSASVLYTKEANAVGAKSIAYLNKRVDRDLFFGKAEPWRAISHLGEVVNFI